MRCGRVDSEVWRSGVRCESEVRSNGECMMYFYKYMCRGVGIEEWRGGVGSEEGRSGE